MRRLLFTLILMMLWVSVARATVITVASQTVPNWYGSTTVELRIFLNKGYITSDGKTLQSGNTTNGISYLRVPCPVVSQTLTINSFSIDSTIDGQDSSTAKYSAFFYDTTLNRMIQAYQGFESFSVSSVYQNGTTTNWPEIRQFNVGVVPVPPDNLTYSRTEINRLFTNMQGLTNPMTNLGDMIVGGSGGSPMKLGGNVTTAKQFLSSTGNGSSATLPAYLALTGTDITTALTYTPINKAGDTNIGNLTLTGVLTLAGPPTLTNQAATKGYVDGKVGGLASLNGSSFANPTFANDSNVTISTNTGTGVNTLTWVGLLPPSRGGTGIGAYGTGDLLFANSSTTLTTLGIGVVNRVLTSTGSAPQWSLLSLTSSVSGVLPGANGGTGSANITFTGPSTPQSYVLPVTGTTILTALNAVTAIQGGTGITAYTVGDILYANTTTSLAKIGIGGANTVLHGGVSAPSYSAVNLTTDVSNLLPVSSGGSGASTLTGYLKGNGTSAFTAVSTPLPIGDLIASATTNGVHYSGASATLNTAVGATGTVLIGNTAAAPSFSNSPTLTALTLSGLTQNSIIFAGASGALSQNTTRLTWDNAANIFKLQGGLRFYGITSSYTGLQGPDTGSAVTFKLPASDGMMNWSLVTDGSGNLSFANISGGGGGGGITTLNTLTALTQTFQVGTSPGGGNDFNIVSSVSTHTFNLPDASATVRGVITSGTQTIGGAKTLNNTLTFAAGSTTVAPFLLQAGGLLSTKVNHAFEWDGTNAWLTDSGNNRNKIAYTTSNITGTAFGITDNLAGAISGPYTSTSYNQIVPRAMGGTGISISNTTLSGTTGYMLRSDGLTPGGLSLSPDASGLTNLNASQLTSGTISLSRFTTVDVAHGGTGITAFNPFDIFYASSNGLAMNQLGGNTSTARMYVGMTGTGTNPQAPTWSKVSVAELTEYTSTSGTGTVALRTTITSPSANDVIAYVSGDWVNISNSSLLGLLTHNFLSATHGDTVASTPVLGGIVVANATPKWDQLAGNTTTTKKFLTQTGNGTISASPGWNTIANGDIAELLSISDLTTYNGVSGNGTTAIASTMTSLATGALLAWNGTNWVNTSISSLATNDLLQWNGTNWVNATVASMGMGTVTHTAGALTANAFLYGNTGNDIKATAAATNGQILIGSTSANPVPNVPTSSGSITVGTGAGTLSFNLNMGNSNTWTAAQTFANLTLNHLITNGSTPSSALGATAQVGSGAGGANASLSVNGTDTSGVITFKTGSTTVPTNPGVLFTITFANSYGSAPNVVFSPANASAGTNAPQVYISSTTTTTFVMSDVVTAGGGVTFKWYYTVSQ